MGVCDLPDRDPGRAGPHRLAGRAHATASTSPAARWCRCGSSSPRRSTPCGSALDRVRLGDSVIQEFGDAQEYLIRIPASSGALEETSKKVEQGMREAGAAGLRGAPARVRRAPGRAGPPGRRRSTRCSAGMAGILIYTALRFDFRGGVAAIIALLHDVLVALAALSIANREMSLPGAGGAPHDRRATPSTTRSWSSTASARPGAGVSGRARRWRTSSTPPSTRPCPGRFSPP